MWFKDPFTKGLMLDVKSSNQDLVPIMDVYEYVILKKKMKLGSFYN